jgi:hypothetical protein
LDAKERLKIAILINKNIRIGRVLNDLVSREELAAPDKICTLLSLEGITSCKLEVKSLLNSRMVLYES